MAKRQVEVFTAGCPVCDPTVQMVNELACPDCEVHVRDTRETENAQAAELYGIKHVPTVIIEGAIAACCADHGPSETVLREAGLGQRLS